MSFFKSLHLGSLVLLLGFTSYPIYAGNLYLETNQAKIIKLEHPADTVIIGNPLIADASVQSSDTLVLTAKGFGITNLVVLGSDGTPILEKSIIVSRQTASSIRVYRQSNLQTLSCTPICEGAYRNEAEKESDLITSKQ